MTKRKRDDLADTVHMQAAQHADGEAAKPLTFCFSSKFDFKLDPNFTSKLYTHKENEGQHIIHSSMVGCKIETKKQQLRALTNRRTC